MFNWKHEGRKKRGRPRRTCKDGIYTAISERDLRKGEWNNRGDGVWKSEGVAEVLKPRYVYKYEHNYKYIYINLKYTM